MRRPNVNEMAFLRMLRHASGRHRFSPEDNVNSEAHRMLRTLKARGYVSVEEENAVTTVSLTALGQEEVEHG